MAALAAQRGWDAYWAERQALPLDADAYGKPQSRGFFALMRLELETLHGTVVRLGGAHGVLTPTNAVAYAAPHPSLDGAPAPA